MDYNDSAKDLTLEEWLSKPRKFCKKSRAVTMQEYINQAAPLPFMEEKVIGHINKISKQDKRKQNEELQQAFKKRDKAILKYKELEKTGELPTIQERIYYRADGLDSEYILANMRKKWKKDNM